MILLYIIKKEVFCYKDLEVHALFYTFMLPASTSLLHFETKLQFKENVYHKTLWPEKHNSSFSWYDIMVDRKGNSGA
jgi:hypothetical protein